MKTLCKHCRVFLNPTSFNTSCVIMNGDLLSLYIVTMKILKTLTVISLAISTLAAPFTVMAADEGGTKKAKPYVLKTCIISGDKLGEMGKPVVYVHEGREIKFCCKDC